MNNQKKLTPVIIALIIIALLAGGILAWQYFGVLKEEIGVPEEIISEGEVVTDIIVISPTPNQIITNPVRVSGKSDTFEANVRIRIKDDNNKFLADTFTMGGTLGTLGPFTKDIFYIKPSAPKGVIEVFEDCPKSGEEINKVFVPIIFGPYEERVVNIRVIYPDGGERWELGKSYKVRWEAIGAEKVTAFLVLPQQEAKKENCLESFRLISHAPADFDGGRFNIGIPSNICSSNRYKVKICDAESYVVGVELCDESDNYFSIE